MTTFHIITLFPEALDSYINESIIGRAQKNKKIKIKFYNPRDFSGNKHRQVDDKPYGGGPGMVMQAGPILRAVEGIKKKIATASAKSSGVSKKVKVIIFTTDGAQFTNTKAKNLASKHKDIILICGRYEGVDARVAKILKAEKVSVGPFVLTGGELPAMIVLDAVSRQIKGVLGKFESVEESRISSSETYTRPEVVEYNGKKYKVPKVLVSGDHKKIDEWRKGGSS